jgi:hypothetical protein
MTRPTTDIPRMAITIEEFCRRYGICRETAYAESRRGKLRIRKLGRRSIITLADERAWRESLPPLHPRQV